MPSELDVLLDKIHDDALRADIRLHVERLKARRTFGLVFESHLPERVRLPEHPVRVGVKVSYRDERNSPSFEVLKLKGKTATMHMVRQPDGKRLSEDEIKKIVPVTADVKDLVVMADFGEPVFPGLKSVGSIERSKGKPAHMIIKGENHHVLEALQFTHAGKVDCIYIDPPYNTGARDWKYDNNYIDETDAYRHSKWLAFMERRLLLAKRLLKPTESVLIVTIDEKEYLRLGLLLEQTFPNASIEMVTSVISAKGVARVGQFSRVEEYLFFVRIGSAVVQLGEQNMLDESRSASAQIGNPIDWLGLRRREPTAKRGARPNQFYPIFVNKETGFIHSIGDAITDDVDRHRVPAPKGTFAVWPLRPNGGEGLWGITPETANTYLKGGYIRARNYDAHEQKVAIHYLPSGTVEAIQEGRIEVIGKDPDGAVVGVHRDRKGVIPKRVWNMPSHNAETGGSNLLSKFIPNRRFPFPKSLYAVEDSLRFFVSHKKDAVIVDFFGGSGTTAHAVARLNRQDDGHRQAILITNNEVSAEEAEDLRAAGHRPGDQEWEKLGIYEHVTKPRIIAAITGKTPEGEPVEGDYKFTDPFAMKEGFEENAEFFELTYLDLEAIELDQAFSGIAPLLWLRAGAQGPLIDERRTSSGRRKPFEWTDRYGVLFSADAWRPFVEACPRSATAAFIVTDSQTTFAGIVGELPAKLDTVRLYENYLTTFAINGTF